MLLSQQSYLGKSALFFLFLLVVFYSCVCVGLCIVSVPLAIKHDTRQYFVSVRQTYRSKMECNFSYCIENQVKVISYIESAAACSFVYLCDFGAFNSKVS